MSAAAIEIDLRLHDLRYFFSTPEIDPFAGESLDESGIDNVMDQLRAYWFPQRRRVRTTLHVPAGPQTEALAPHMEAALAGYCDTHVRYEQRKLREVRADGLRALCAGMVFLALCIGLSALFEALLREGSLLSRVLVEGAIIAGWVGLWRPIELLLFEWWPHARAIRLYRLIGGMELEICRGADTKPAQ